MNGGGGGGTPVTPGASAKRTPEGATDFRAIMQQMLSSGIFGNPQQPQAGPFGQVAQNLPQQMPSPLTANPNATPPAVPPSLIPGASAPPMHDDPRRNLLVTRAGGALSPYLAMRSGLLK